MWTRAQLKTNAKASLGRGIFKSRWMMGLLAAFLGLLLAGGIFFTSLPGILSTLNFNINFIDAPADSIAQQSIVRNVSSEDLEELQELFDQLENNLNQYYDDTGEYNLPDDFYNDMFGGYIEETPDGGYDFDFGNENGGIFDAFGPYFLEIFKWIMVVVLIITLIVFLISVVYSIFVGNIIEAGMIRYFLANRDISVKEAPSMGLLFSFFKKGQYAKTAKAMAWRLLFLVLWGIIPVAGPIIAIIKNYSYYFVPHIMADNPELGFKDALNMSKEMTKGSKWKMFVLDLSFLGWYIVGLLCLGIGVLWVNPYYLATYAELYDVLKKTSIANGRNTPEAFSMNRSGLVLNVPYISNPYYDRKDSSYAPPMTAPAARPTAQYAPQPQAPAPMTKPAEYPKNMNTAYQNAQTEQPMPTPDIPAEPAPIEFDDTLQTEERSFDMPDPAAFDFAEQPQEQVQIQEDLIEQQLQQDHAEQFTVQNNYPEQSASPVQQNSFIPQEIDTDYTNR